MVPWPAANQPAGRVAVSRRGQALGRAALFVLVLTAAALLAWKLGAFVTYALKLTRTPHAVVKSDLEPLRAVGLSDRGLHDLVAVVAYFNFVNRVAAGLGVELEATT